MVIAALMAAFLALMIFFYYRYSSDKNTIQYLENEKARVVQELAQIKADVDRYAGLNEVYKLELEDSRDEINKLMDSVGKLQFTIAGLKRDLRFFNRLRRRVDSLQVDNQRLRAQLGEAVVDMKELERENSQFRDRLDIDMDNRWKRRLRRIETEAGISGDVLTALDFSGAELSAYRLNSGRPVFTEVADKVRKLRACVRINENSRMDGEMTRPIYMQILTPDSTVVVDSDGGMQIGPHTMSRKIDVKYSGDRIDLCNTFDIPESTLNTGTYVLHVYENGLRRVSTQIVLK